MSKTPRFYSEVSYIGWDEETEYVCESHLDSHGGWRSSLIATGGTMSDVSRVGGASVAAEASATLTTRRGDVERSECSVLSRELYGVFGD